MEKEQSPAQRAGEEESVRDRHLRDRTFNVYPSWESRVVCIMCTKASAQRKA